MLKQIPLIQFDQPFHPVILYENYLSRMVMNINKLQKMCIDLVLREREGVRSSLGVPCCFLEQDTFTSNKSSDNTQAAIAPSRHD